MSNKPGKKKKLEHMRQMRKTIRQRDKYRKQAAAYLESGPYQIRLSKQMAWKWIFIILFLFSMAGNIWQFVRLM